MMIIMMLIKRVSIMKIKMSMEITMIEMAMIVLN